jgi:thioesterase domain-containing protein
MLKSKGKRLKQRLRRVNGAEKNTVQLKDVLDLSTYPEAYVRYAESHWEALTQYQPKPYEGEIVLFRAKKQGLSNFDHTLNWNVLAGDRVIVEVIPGTHEKMMQEPSVQIVAAKLGEFLNDAYDSNQIEPERELAIAAC